MLEHAECMDGGFEEAFPRIHKLALGVAIGLTSGVSIWLLTIVRVMLRPGGIPMNLLKEFFYGYTVTWSGAFVGFAWAFACGFVGGWLLGFVHNVTLDLWLLVVRARTDLSLRRHFPDHIR